MILACITAHEAAGGSMLPDDINSALRSEYGVVLDQGCHGHHAEGEAAAAGVRARPDGVYS